MLSVSDARARARRRTESEGRAWAVADELDAVELSLPLHPPTERAVLADLASALDWVGSWRGVDGVLWAARSWPSAGRQQVPERLVLHGATAIAAFGGRGVLRDWERMRRQVQVVRQAFPSPVDGEDAFRDALRAKGRDLAELDDRDLLRLTALLSWFAEHPQSGLHVRQVPVRGVHTKWLERHRGLVTRLHEALTGRTELGLAPASPALVRIRVLDPALRPHALTDLTLPVAELAAWAPIPAAVIVVENLQNLLSLPDLEGTIALFGSGNDAGPRLAPVTWLHDVDLAYWGDLDSHGFRILDQWRGVFPATRSVLMDEATLLAHRDLWVDEEKPYTGACARLHEDERAALDRLRLEGDVRLEQERIPLDIALAHLRARPSPVVS